MLEYDWRKLQPQPQHRISIPLLEGVRLGTNFKGISKYLKGMNDLGHSKQEGHGSII